MLNFLRKIYESVCSVIMELIVLFVIGILVAWMGGLLGLQSGARIMVLGLFAIVSVWACIATAAVVKKRKLVTPLNVEDRIKEWLDRFGIEHQRIQVPPEMAFFSHRITMPGAAYKVNITRPVEPFANSLWFSAFATLTKEENDTLISLGQQASANFHRHFRSECAKARVGYTKVSDSPFQVRIDKHVPIARGFTEYEFLSNLSALQQVTHIILTQIELWIINEQKEAERRLADIRQEAFLLSPKPPSEPIPDMVASPHLPTS